MFSLFFYIFLLNFFTCYLNDNDNKIIISLTSNHKYIYNTILIINSISLQKLDENLYEILLILSLNEYQNIYELPEEIQLLEKLKKIKILLVNEILSNQRRTLITMKKYNNNAIIIINNECLLPYGWLKMLIEDHFKYPNDAIAASIQYFFGKNGKITEIAEGFKGEKFGTFNHVTEMIFNFALFNMDLGGILYPKKFFQNKFFYDLELFSKIKSNSEEFWQSCFIIMEDKILRQSSKIFDYTKYLINDINNKEFNINKKKLLEKSKLSFIREFSNFNDYIKKRQNKIIVSITSYPARFIYLPGLMTFIKNQSFPINKIIFFFYKDDIKYYNLNISDAEIILIDKNLRPHLKYFYAMEYFKEYAIITLDDDAGYVQDTFETLYNSYIENPNLISGRRGHLMTYKKNGEIKKYRKWVYEQKSIKEPSFDLTLTNVGGTIFPPDILNINEKLLPIINETLTCDDLTLKYFSIIKGIPPKWIVNNKINGIHRKLPKTKDSPLSKVNFINNNKCINKLNMMINSTILPNLCINYRNVITGNSIYLFDIHNEIIINQILYFDIYAFSYCPIDKRIKFNIYFDNYSSTCFFNESNYKIYSNNNYSFIDKLEASCFLNSTENNLDNFYFPKVISKNNIIIKIYNYRKSLTSIFHSFFCEKLNNCILNVIQYDNEYKKNFSLIINDKQYLCKIKDNNNNLNNKFPIIEKFICNKSKCYEKKKKIIVTLAEFL